MESSKNRIEVLRERVVSLKKRIADLKKHITDLKKHIADLEKRCILLKIAMLLQTNPLTPVKTKFVIERLGLSEEDFKTPKECIYVNDHLNVLWSISEKMTQLASDQKKPSSKFTNKLMILLKRFGMSKNPRVLQEINQVLFPDCFYKDSVTIIVFGKSDGNIAVVTQGDPHNIQYGGNPLPILLEHWDDVEKRISSLLNKSVEKKDIVFICVNPAGRVIASSKGCNSTMTCMLIKNTYDRHTQESKFTFDEDTLFNNNVPILQCTDIPRDENIINIVTYILTQFSRNAYNAMFGPNSSEQLETFYNELRVPDRWLLSLTEEKKRNHFAEQISWLKALLDGHQLNSSEYYTKDGLAAKLVEGTAHEVKDARYLFDGHHSGRQYNESLMEYIIAIIKKGIMHIRGLSTPKRVQNVRLQEEAIKTKLATDKYTEKVYSMLDPFCKDTRTMSPELKVIYDEKISECPENPQSVFQTPSTKEAKMLELFGSDCWNHVKPYFDLMDQKSQRWVEEIRKINGQSGVPKNLQDLIRGCLTESIIQALINKGVLQLELKDNHGGSCIVTVGFISHGNSIMAPDGLLIIKTTDGKIIIHVLEMKALKSRVIDKSKMREIKLAISQTESTVALLEGIFQDIQNVSIGERIILFGIFETEDGCLTIEQY
jgi:hypothetical protein